MALPDDVRRRRGLEVMRLSEQANPKIWHYLSFVDETGFLGVCWVEARGILDACSVARAHGVNPGGEVMCKPLPGFGQPPDGSAYVLHRDKATIDRLCSQWSAPRRS